MLSKTEKEQRVIELYQQGKNIRQIAQEVHMSFADIGAIERKGCKMMMVNQKNNKIT
jgi:transcriptional regulator